MTKKIRYTYRPPEELYEAIAKESNRKKWRLIPLLQQFCGSIIFPTKRRTNTAIRREEQTTHVGGGENANRSSQ